MKKKSFPLSKVYDLLEPGPVAMMEFEPPIVGCVISNRNDTFGLLKATKVSFKNEMRMQ